MIELTYLASLLLASGQPGQVVTIHGRDMAGLRDREDVIRGSCDGHPASATIVKAYRGRAGRLTLRGGRFARDIPATFLGGALFRQRLTFAGLGCDGRRLQLHALAIRPNARGELVMDIQDATLDLRTGVVSTTDLRTLTPAETLAELR